MTGKEKIVAAQLRKDPDTGKIPPSWVMVCSSCVAGESKVVGTDSLCVLVHVICSPLYTSSYLQVHCHKPRGDTGGNSAGCSWRLQTGCKTLHLMNPPALGVAVSCAELLRHRYVLTLNQLARLTPQNVLIRRSSPLAKNTAKILVDLAATVQKPRCCQVSTRLFVPSTLVFMVKTGAKHGQPLDRSQRKEHHK